MELTRVLLWATALLAFAAVAGCATVQRREIPWERLEAKYGGANSRYMELSGDLRVHYRDEGRPNGPVIVLVPGFSASLQVWEPWVRALRDRYRVITLDLPGNGLTRAPADYSAWPDGYVRVVDELTERLGVQRFVIGGNSMGGSVARAYAIAHPGRLDGLVVVDGAPAPRERDGKRDAISRTYAMLAGEIGVRTFQSPMLVKQGLYATYIDRKLVTPALIDRYTEPVRAPGHRRILIDLKRDYEEPSARRLAATGIPILVMQGCRDPVIPVSGAKRFAAAIPTATLILYDGVGHVPMEQIPEKSAADLRQWLETKAYPPS